MIPKIRVFEAFSGVGSQRMALRNLGIDHEVVATSDVDEFAVKSYAVVHDSNKIVSQVTDEEMQDYLEKRNIPLNDKGVRKILKGKKLREFYEACIKSNNLGDISKVETQDIPDHDLFTYSFPCQDISVAGKGLGLNEGSDTRSGLLWECQKVIAGKKPKYLLLENVKNLVGKKHKHNFDKWLEWLEDQGYTNYWQVLNAKDYGIPQNRERVFVVSILGEHEPYKFPEPIELELRLKDVLENEVDERFYLDDEKVDKLIINSDKISIGYIPRTNGTQHQSNTIYKTDAESPNMQARDYKDPVKILIKNATKKGYLEATHGDGVDLAYPTSRTRRGRVQKRLNQTLDTGGSKGVIEKIGNIYPSGGQNGNVYETKGISPTISSGSTSTKGNGGIGSNNAPKVLDNFRIRKLTPKECWRLMGFNDEDFHKAEEVNSNTQLYKQAGNSIVVDVLEGIFKQLLGVKE